MGPGEGDFSGFSGGGGGSCSGLSGWQQISYSAGALITEGGRKYECKPYPYTGWCGGGTNYKPTSGFAWQDAWNDLGACQ